MIDKLMDPIREYQRNNKQVDCIFGTAKVIYEFSKLANISRRERTQNIYGSILGVQLREFNADFNDNAIVDYRSNFIKMNGREPNIIAIR